MFRVVSSKIVAGSNWQLKCKVICKLKWILRNSNGFNVPIQCVSSIKTLELIFKSILAIYIYRSQINAKNAVNIYSLIINLRIWRLVYKHITTAGGICRWLALKATDHVRANTQHLDFYSTIWVLYSHMD